MKLYSEKNQKDVSTVKENLNRNQMDNYLTSTVIIRSRYAMTLF